MCKATARRIREAVDPAWRLGPSLVHGLGLMDTVVAVFEIEYNIWVDEKVATRCTRDRHVVRAPFRGEDTQHHQPLYWLLLLRFLHWYKMALARIALAIMGQNLALKNIVEKGFPISVYNRTTSKMDKLFLGAVNGGLIRLVMESHLVLLEEEGRTKGVYSLFQGEQGALPELGKSSLASMTLHTAEAELFLVAVTGGLIRLITEGGLFRGTGTLVSIEVVDSSISLRRSRRSKIWSILYMWLHLVLLEEEEEEEEEGRT